MRHPSTPCTNVRFRAPFAQGKRKRFPPTPTPHFPAQHTAATKNTASRGRCKKSRCFHLVCIYDFWGGTGRDFILPFGARSLLLSPVRQHKTAGGRERKPCKSLARHRPLSSEQPAEKPAGVGRARPSRHRSLEAG